MLKNAALMHAQLQLQSTYKRAEVAKKKKTKRRRRRSLKRQTNDLHTTRAEIMIKVMCYVRVCVYMCACHRSAAMR